jgi:hypothetical protein
MGQGLSGSSKLIIAARGYSKEQSQIQADPIFGPYEMFMGALLAQGGGGGSRGVSGTSAFGRGREGVNPGRLRLQWHGGSHETESNPKRNPNRENEPKWLRRSGFPRWTNVAEGYNRTTNVDWCSASFWGSLDEAYRGPQSFGSR